jgi:hypothetical protein
MLRKVFVDALLREFIPRKRTSEPLLFMSTRPSTSKSRAVEPLLDCLLGTNSALLGGVGGILLFALLVYGQDVPLGGDALEEFSFPIVFSLSRQGLRLLGPPSAFIRSYGWTRSSHLGPYCS